MKELTIDQLKKIKLWTYRGVLVFCALVFISWAIPKNTLSGIHFGPIIGLRGILMWGFVLLEIICSVVTFLAGHKISQLKRKKEMEDFVAKQKDFN